MKPLLWILMTIEGVTSCRHTPTASIDSRSPASRTNQNQQAISQPEASPSAAAAVTPSSEALTDFLAYCRSPDTPDIQHTVSVLLAYVQETDCIRANEALSKLTRLILRDKGITDVQPLAGFDQVTVLDLDNNKIEYIAPLNRLRKKLTYFSFQQNIAYEIEKNAPIAYLDQRERYKLSSALWYVKQVRVTDKSGLDLPAFGNLPSGKKGEKNWMYVPKDPQYNTVVAGNTSIAQTYVFVKYGVEGLYTDIFYWFFYPYNGPGTAETYLEAGRHFETYPIGIHEGDWEGIQVRLTPDRKVEKVGLKRHGTPFWYQPEEILWEGTHPIFFPSRNGHAATPNPKGITYNPIGGVYFYDLASYGERFESFIPERIVLCATSLHPHRIFDPSVLSWNRFFGRWGALQKGFDVEADAETFVKRLIGDSVLDFPVRIALQTLFQTALLNAEVRANLDMETGGGPFSPFDGWYENYPLPEDQETPR
jgi:hypothetical protein